MRRLQKAFYGIALALVLAVLCTGCQLFEPDYIEVTVEESTFENRYYYSTLSKSDQRLYQELYQGLSEQREEFVVHCADGEESNRIFYMVLMDFPELFWPDGNVVSTAYDDTYTTVEAEYNCTEEERVTKQSEIEEAATQILNSVPIEYGEYEKIKYIYEYMVNYVEYVKDSPDNQNMYSALVNKVSVCAGYAKMTQYLLNRLGIFCTYVIGEATTEGTTDGHAWNIVKCNDKYYYVDTTWADPLFTQKDERVEAAMVYDYLCCSDTMLAATHVADDQYVYPVCDSDDLNYYSLNGMYYESADRSTLRKAMFNSIDEKAESTIMKFANADVYTQSRDLIVNSLLSEATQRLGRKYGIYQVTCYYVEDPQLNKFIVYWNYE